jgi:outer membrane autotransporter protein
MTPFDGMRAGLFLGGVAASGAVGTSQDTTMTGLVTGGHWGLDNKRYFVDLSATVGLLDLDSERHVTDNTASGGLVTADGETNGVFLSPALTLGTRIETAQGLLTPSLRLRYTHLTVDGYAESGSADDLVVDGRSADEIELRAQLALALPTVLLDAGNLGRTIRLGADLVHRSGEAVDAELLGQAQQFDTGAQGTFARGFLGLDLDYRLSEATKLFARADFVLDDEGGRSTTTSVGLSHNF